MRKQPTTTPAPKRKTQDQGPVEEFPPLSGRRSTPTRLSPFRFPLSSSGFPLSAFRFRRGFTLVEMLVVIAIIGLLAALLIPAIYAAVTRAREATITNDVTQLEMAVEQYKNTYNDYPPNFFEDYSSVPWGQTVVARHLKRISRSAGELMPQWNHTFNSRPLLGVPNPNANNATQIDAAECLVFWLGGLSKSAANPTSGTGGPMELQNNNVAFRPLRDRQGALFPFREERLTDIDNDGIPEYVPPYGPRVPYVYFDGRAYDNQGLDQASPSNVPDDDYWAQYPPGDPSSQPTQLVRQYGAVKPYVVGHVTNNQSLPVYANNGKFQIISAGLDGLYGEPGATEFTGTEMKRKVYLTEHSQTQPQFSQAIQYKKQDLDNIANFSGGTLESQAP